MMSFKDHTRVKLLNFIYEVQEGRVPNQMLLEYAAAALLRSLNKKEPDVVPPSKRGRSKGEQRNFDREICIVWLRKIRQLTQEEVCEQLAISEPKTIQRAEGYFEKATLAEIREYNKILTDYRFKRKIGVIPAGDYYKVMCVFDGRHIVDADGEKEAHQFIFDELERGPREAIASMTKADSK